ncbi:hypothetical protein UFOVP1320_5 [uncultured Caudovirales phage]|jgi:hypothetical protein|uniref:Uncharacterized protein n=3 Tax=uncultured Caudovirales phage TaxID=2100421 RepID=A0A6J5SDZ7_9CAUD|nr:hypothetical protein UFOVP548_20 [uncultured Caudovirales phage]CAB4169936.1 hypothetical protein UFOVP904_20 [uncultured Caudovirales phage]CAB4197299.1 hypothetical protein UFOVP1320_5 [uncultured Caudovirales phage]CAB4211838.1 hypothetical protein UFOVP1431_50 [uncultured Caudovirales phage]CAB5227525.1 hypothetical protein UFOVP1527_51 [uncultured Caudovirales phage]
MGRADYLLLGDNNAVCYQCGRKRKSSTLLKHWQGYWVCPEHWETRQPQDFVRNVEDIQTPPWAQPMPANLFAYVCTMEGRQGIAGFGIAGCATTGLNLNIQPGSYSFCDPQSNLAQADYATADCALVPF